MIDRLMAVGGEGAGGLAGLPVEVDGRAEREDAGGESRPVDHIDREGGYVNEWTVAIGVDTHKQAHVAVALDRLGVQIDSCSVTADASL